MTDTITLTNLERMELTRRANGRTRAGGRCAGRARLILLLAGDQRIVRLYSRHRGQSATVLTARLEARILEATRRAPTDD